LALFYFISIDIISNKDVPNIFIISFVQQKLSAEINLSMPGQMPKSRNGAANWKIIYVFQKVWREL